MKLLYTAVTSFLFLVLHALASDDATLNAILRKHMEAMGGLSNWHKVESLRLAGTIERDGQTVDIVIIKKRPDQIRATVTVPIPGEEDAALQLIHSHDGKTAWTATRPAGAPNFVKEELPADAADELLADAGVLPRLIKLWREGAELELLNSKTIDGISCYVIAAKPANFTNSYTFYISTEDYLVTHYTNEHPDKGLTVTHLSDYTSKNGVLIATLNTVDSSETGRSTMSTKSVKIGVGIYEEYFADNKK